MPGPRKLVFGRAVRLVVGRLEDERHASRRVVMSLSLPAISCVKRLTLDHARTGDEEERTVDADLEIGE